MKKVFTLVLCALFVINMAQAQWQSGTAGSHKRVKSIRALNQTKDINNISGNVTCTGNYIPNATGVLNFEVTVSSPDEEYLDGLTMVFPTGMTPIITGTSDPITANNGCSSATGQLNPISGQTITWGEITTPTGCGYLDAGTYTFSVGVTIGAITGAQTISYTIHGDGYGGTPHSVTGNIQVNEAAANDVGVSAIGLSSFYQPAATVTPTVTVNNYGTAAQTFDVLLKFNDGTSDVYTQTLNVSALAPGGNQQLTFPNWTAVIGNYTATAITQLTGDAYTSNDTDTYNFVVAATFPGYAWNAYDPATTIDLGPIQVMIPSGQVVSISEDTSDFMSGADFVNNQWFAAQYSSTGNSNIYTIDKTTGVKTLVGASGVGITGLAYDITSSKLYASVWTDPDSYLYTINTGTGVATLVGNMNLTDLVIGIAANNAGNIYGITLTNNNLVSINKTTGAGTVVGPLGFDIAYAQDIAFDRDNNKLYGTLWATNGIFAEINTSTGAATQLAPLGPEIDGFAIPYTFTLPDNDVMVQSITAIPSGCGLSNAQAIQIRVFNNGAQPQSNIPVYYTINGGTQVTGTVAGPIASQGYADYTFGTTADLSAYGAYTIVACTDLTTDTTTANDCSTITTNNIQPSTVPYNMGFETTDNTSGWKMFDANTDNFTWDIIDQQTLAHTGNGLAIYEYNTDATTAANDWMFSTCINLTAGTDYKIEFWYKVGAWQGTAYPEKLKVAIGNAQTVAAMTQVINDLGTIDDTTYTKFAATFTVPTTGTYFLGWHAYSDADAFYIAIDDVALTLSTGIDNKTAENAVQIFPNPAKDQLNITSTNPVQNVKVYNSIGQLIINNHIDAMNYSLNTSSFNYGVYYIQIETKEGIVNKKFVIAE